MDWKKLIITFSILISMLIPTVIFAHGDMILLDKGNNSISVNKSDYCQTIDGKKGCCHKKNLPDEVKEQIQELKLKLENDEITKEQFREELKELLPDKFENKKGKKGFFKRKNH